MTMLNLLTLSSAKLGAAVGCGGHKPSGASGLLQIAAVGDSITYGAHSTGGNSTYPGQLQLMLDSAPRTAGRFCVTNLGESGATMQKSPHGDSPYWKRGSFAAFTAKKWDYVVIMLGTNDAKDACGESASYCNDKIKPPLNSCCNWPHAGQTNWTQDCSGDDMKCSFAQDYKAFIALARTLGTSAATIPDIWLAAPPPLIDGGSTNKTAKPYGMNQTVINDILPPLMQRINQANAMPHHVIDVFGALGGTSGLECGYGAAETLPFLCSHACVGDEHTPECSNQCDAQSCDPCHPNDSGYTVLAAAVLKAMAL